MDFLKNYGNTHIGGEKRDNKFADEWEVIQKNNHDKLIDEAKQDRSLIPKKDIKKHDKAIWLELEDIYVLTLQRSLIEPNEFSQDYQYISTSYWTVLCKNFDRLEKLFDNA